MNGSILALACAFVLAALARPAAARNEIGCRDLPAPDGARVAVVADNIAMNGVPMAIRELRWSQAPDQLLRFYRSTWEARADKVVESVVGGWRVLATRDGECFYTVQAKAAADAGTYALLGVTHAPADAATRAPGSGFPMMSGSRVANDIASKDGFKNARTLLLLNQFSQDANASFYRNALAGQGWEIFLDRSVLTEKGPARVLVWRRGMEETSMTIGKSGNGSLVAANIVDKP